jgi:hypoxanthine-DNA glycosylase
MKIYSFPPIQANNAKVLILGTMPSVQSLLHNQYYGNKQNSFWQLMFAVFEQPFTNDYGAKTRLLPASAKAVLTTILSTRLPMILPDCLPKTKA